MGLPIEVLRWSGELLLIALLFRAVQRGLLIEYPYFYAYIACVACGEVVRIYLSIVNPGAYALGWWITEFITAPLGFGVTWEIYTHTFSPYQGVCRMVRRLVYWLLVLVLSKVLVGFVVDPHQTLVPITLELEQNLRILQALLLLALAGLILRYSMPMGRNIGSMLMGYGLFIGSNVITLALRAEWGAGFQQSWTILQPVEYCATLLIWCSGMWVYKANPAPDRALECDYERVSEQTIQAFGRLRNHLSHAWRSQ